MDKDSITSSFEVLAHMGRVCDDTGVLLAQIEEKKDAVPFEETLASVVETLTTILTESRRVISLIGVDLATLKADLTGKANDLESTKTTLSLLKISYTAHRGMLEKIVRMKTAAGGRNTEAALAAESFLAQNPAI